MIKSTDPDEPLHPQLNIQSMTNERYQNIVIIVEINKIIAKIIFFFEGVKISNIFILFNYTPSHLNKKPCQTFGCG